MDALLHGLQQFRIDRLLPEVLDAGHGLEEVGRERRGVREVRVVQDCHMAGVAAERPPLLLNVRIGEPLDVLQCLLLLIRIGDDRDALTAKGRGCDLLLRIDEEAGFVTADRFVLGNAGEEGEPVHLHGDLARLIGVEIGDHVSVRMARRCAAFVHGLVEVESRCRVRRIDVALHVIGLVRVLVLEAPGIHRRGHAHGDAFPSRARYRSRRRKPSCRRFLGPGRTRRLP